MASVKFYLLNTIRNGKKVDWEISIYMDFIINRDQRFRYKLEEKIHPGRWNKKSQEAKKDINLNLELQRLKSSAMEFYRKNKYEDIETIKAGIQNIMNPVKQKKADFFAEFDVFLEMKKQTQKHSTHKGYLNLYDNLKDFSVAYNMDMAFSKVNTDLLENFQLYLSDKGILNGTIRKRIVQLKTFLRHTLQRNIHTNNKFATFKPVKGYETPIVTLTQNEVLQFQNYQFENKYLEQARDLWLFSFSTVQRWSDVIRFDKGSIQNDVWKFNSHKTNSLIRVPLAGFGLLAKQILEKYNYQLPLISERSYSNYLKDAAREAGLTSQVTLSRMSGNKRVVDKKEKWVFLSSHSARRTGVTFLLERNVPSATVRQITGHKDLATLSKYENIQFEALEKAYQEIGTISEPAMKVSSSTR